MEVKQCKQIWVKQEYNEYESKIYYEMKNTVNDVYMDMRRILNKENFEWYRGRDVGESIIWIIIN